MAAATALCRKARQLQSFRGIGGRLHPGLHRQPTRLTYCLDRVFANRPSPHISPHIFSRPFALSARLVSSLDQSRSIGVEWHELSPERQIEWLLSSVGDAKWGWVIYRCTYKPELECHWESFRRLVEERTRESIAESDAPQIAEKLDWVFVKDPALERATRDELKRRFRAWARAENPSYDINNTPYCRGSRYKYFIQVDEDALRSVLDDPNDPTNPANRVDLQGGHVNIVHAWQDPLPLEEATDEFGEAVDNEDWMMIQASMIAPYFYVDLDNDESWYVHYSPPPHGICIW
ncbi:hypothetical protein MMYC01_207423 [Madurella mycetomatis]|uniref:Uncharacterized protein n=1 Tax=Madurella mycetomatis TaxID=100816 RepID=A0A175VXP4_9PEZI|nr:hypothetical protein MMYC01_207423 [Madurella mycetomatis]